METAPLLMGRGSFRGFREARTVAPGSAASGVWSGGAGGLCARGGCSHAPSETAQLFLPEPRGPSEGLLPAELCRAGLAAAPLHIGDARQASGDVRGPSLLPAWDGPHPPALAARVCCVRERGCFARLICVLQASPRWPPAWGLQAHTLAAVTPGTGPWTFHRRLGNWQLSFGGPLL